MSSSNPGTLLSPNGRARRRWKPQFSECFLLSWWRHSSFSISPRRGCRCTHEQRLESAPRRNIARRGGRGAVLHHRAAFRRRVLFCVLAESNPDSRRTERGIRVHRFAAVVSEAALRSDAAAHDPCRPVVFGLLGVLGSVSKENQNGIVGEGHAVG